MARILIIDDDRTLCQMLKRHLRGLGHESKAAFTLQEGLKQAGEGAWDVVFLDVNLPDGNGLDGLPILRSMASVPEVIIFTGDGDDDGAEIAIQRGAWDYIEKPPSLTAMVLPLTRALQYRAAKGKRVRTSIDTAGIVGSSPQLRKCLAFAAEAAGSKENVLLTGESGTGKEIFARVIHRNSDRSARALVVVDCAVIPENLVESVLFGHEKGAFTSAAAAQAGLVRQAHEGTLFLDEIGDLDLHLQKAFLRVLQEKMFRPVGSPRELRSDFRLIAATNRNLDDMARNGQFREDLLFRLKSLVIELPPLRERTGDIMEVALYHTKKISESEGGATKGMSPEFIEALMLYPWPGNVRELLNALERAFENSREEPIMHTQHLPAHVRIHAARTGLRKKAYPHERVTVDSHSGSKLPHLKEFRDAGIADLETQYLRELMRQTNGDIGTACEISGLSRSRIYSLLQQHRIVFAR